MDRGNWIVVALMALIATIAAINTSADTLGLSKQVVAVLNIALVPLGIVLNQLRALGQKAPDPA